MKKKLEVGKTYPTRNGGTVTIVQRVGKDPIPFLGDNGFWYMEDGQAPAIGDRILDYSVAWPPEGATFSPTQVSRLLDALSLARNGCSDTVWRGALVALEEALCPEEGQ